MWQRKVFHPEKKFLNKANKMKTCRNFDEQVQVLVEAQLKAQEVLDFD